MRSSEATVAPAPLAVDVHADAAAFLRAAAPLFSAAEAEYSIIALPAARMVESPRPEDALSYMATVTSAGIVVAAALYVPPGGVLLTDGPPGAIVALATDLAAREAQPESIVGRREACARFGEAWTRQTGEWLRPRFELRHFSLTLPPAPQAASGAMRVATAGDRELVVAWSLAFNDEVGLPDDAERVLSNVTRRVARDEFYLWEAGEPVAMAGFRDGGAGSSTARVAPVFTPPALRGRGYAKALVSGLSRELLLVQRKRAVFLTTDRANPISNALYESLGYRAVADHVHLDFVRAAG